MVRCQKRINLLNCLASTQWGADDTTLLNIYRYLIRSKVEYGWITYSSASHATLKPLKTIENTILMIVSGAFRTSPTESLHCEHGELL